MNKSINESVLRKLKGKADASDKINLRIYENLFGDCAPVGLGTFIQTEGEDADYKTYLHRHEITVRMKLAIMDKTGLVGILSLHEFYKAGGILLFGPDHSTYPDMLLLVICDDGEEKVTSENLNMEVDSNYIDRRFHFLHKESIKGFSLNQHLCPNLDCPNCSHDRDKASEYNLPFRVMIETNSIPVPFFAGSFEYGMVIVNTLLNWLHKKPLIPNKPSKSKKSGIKKA